MRKRRAFTIIELLVAIGIIAILISFMLPMVNRAREHGYRSSCMTNIRHMTAGWLAYAMDNEGQILSSNTGNNTWANAGNTDANIESGILYQYVKEVKSYRCPSPGNIGNDRTYSVNNFLNGEQWDRKPVKTLTALHDAANTFAFIEEYDYRGYNINSFGLYKTGTSWIDRPAHLHGDGCTISFVDGHEQYWRFADHRTLGIDFGANTPNNADLIWLQSVAGY